MLYKIRVIMFAFYERVLASSFFFSSIIAFASQERLSRPMALPRVILVDLIVVNEVNC
jgi:hypothetical protein